MSQGIITMSSATVIVTCTLNKIEYKLTKQSGSTFINVLIPTPNNSSSHWYGMNDSAVTKELVSLLKNHPSFSSLLEKLVLTDNSSLIKPQ